MVNKKQIYEKLLAKIGILVKEAEEEISELYLEKK